MRKNLIVLALAAMLVGLVAGTALAGHEWIIDGHTGHAPIAAQSK